MLVCILNIQFIRVKRLQTFCNSYYAHSKHCPGECRVASSMEQEQHRTMGTTAVNSENVQSGQGNTYQSGARVTK